MNVKSKLIQATAQLICNQEAKSSLKAVESQQKIFNQIIRQARKTKFGHDFHFDKINTIADFQMLIPIRDYEGLKNYFDLIKKGDKNVMWPGQPKYLAKTSGTTSGTKYIPITKASISNHIDSARNALFSYVVHNKNTEIFDGHMLFLSGSPEMEKHNGIYVGRLSGIVNHEIPAWFQRNKLPSASVNIIEPWEKKIDAIIDELLVHDIRAISGIPPWIQMLLERIIERKKVKSIADVFPNLELYIYGGVNFLPYKEKLDAYFGKPITYIETYPASEGFIAYQDDPVQDGMRLITNAGIFYEFVDPQDVFSENPRRFTLAEVELHKDYAIILTSNAGLYAYLIGDIIRFTSIKPFKIKVSGRVGQYISAFGEHVISNEIDYAIGETIKDLSLNVVEFSVAPQVNPTDSTIAYHEWFIEFGEVPKDLQLVGQKLSEHLSQKNSYYKDLLNGNMLVNPKIRIIRPGGFKEYLISIGKYGEQFKVPRLSNDRKVAQGLEKYIQGK